ncbi:MAG TPA: type VI secretion system contractile sheath large subunit [Phycisphaerae bacterium]|nr:type VI secretion system contractile sheath large subunit [Phycisphaerae bacterium]
MAKKKDDFSFGFSTKKKKEEPPAAETPADGSTDAGAETPADPFASSDTPSADPFASTSDTPADPFASSSDTPADPFASSTDAPSNPFASTETPAADATADPFASTDAPAADASADPFASPTDAPAEAPAAKTPQIKEHKQFRILVLGDFSGRANRQLMETGDAVAGRKVHAIDQDSFDRTIARLKPEIALPVSEKESLGLKFNALEDFRPDQLIAQSAALQGMLKLREELKNLKTFKTAAAAVRKLTGEKKAKPAKTAPGAAPTSEFEEMLNRPVAARNAAEATADAIIKSLVSGYEVPDADPDQARMVKLIEDALSAGLRAILRHPAFQAVESSWRGVEFLTSRLNTDEDLKISLFDISKDELYADLNSNPALLKTGMYQILVEQTKVPGVAPFSLIVGNFSFDQNPKDIGLLAKIASLAHEANIPFLAAGTSKIAGFPSFNKFPDSGKWQPPADLPLWDKIRGHKCAAHVGLVAPRFLMRLPYGPKTDAIDAYPFEEMPGTPVHDGYLWGNGAFAVAFGMGEAFLEDGWGFTAHTDVTDLPCHMAVIDGDKEMTPCAEGWLSDRIGAVLHDLGLIPLLSVKNAASVKIAGVHSIAKGGKPLAASWVTA